MIPVYLHYQNCDGDALAYNSVSAKIELPIIPDIGETLFTCDKVQRDIIGAILQKPQRVITWENLICDNDKNEPAFLSLQGCFTVKDRWFYSEDSSIHLLMGEDEERPPRKNRTDEEILTLIPQLEESYAKGKWWY